MKTPNLLLENAKLVLDFYFDEITELGDEIYAVKSNTLPDVGWNYWFSTKKDVKITATICEKAENYFKDHLPTAFFISTEDQIVSFASNIASEGIFSVWMLARSDSLCNPGSVDGYEFVTAEGVSDRAQAVVVFRESYSNGLNDQIGYNDLGEYYTKGFEAGLERGLHYITSEAWQDGKMVGLGTGILNDEHGGLYNVSVVPGHRKQGLGKYISYQCCKQLFEQGAKSVVLQTESKSKVEETYRKIGFNKRFDTKYWSPFSGEKS